MNAENIKEMAVKAKDKVAEFVVEHEADIAVFAGMAVSTWLGMTVGYLSGCNKTMGTIISNEQKIRYEEARTAANVSVYTDNIPKK